MSRHELALLKNPRSRVQTRRHIKLAVPVLGALLVLTMFAYVALTNNVATQGYKLSALQKQIDELKKENDAMQLNVTAVQSLPYVKAETGGVSLAPVAHVEYLATNGSSVALR